MAVDDLAVAARQHRDLEAELADAAAHAIHRGVVLAGIAGVEDQLVDRPLLDGLRDCLRNHVHTSSKLSWFGGFFRRVRFALACRTEPLEQLYPKMFLAVRPAGRSQKKLNRAPYSGICTSEDCKPVMQRWSSQRQRYRPCPDAPGWPAISSCSPGARHPRAPCANGGHSTRPPLAASVTDGEWGPAGTSC